MCLERIADLPAAVDNEVDDNILAEVVAILESYVHSALYI